MRIRGLQLKRYTRDGHPTSFPMSQLHDFRIQWRPRIAHVRQAAWSDPSEPRVGVQNIIGCGRGRYVVRGLQTAYSKLATFTVRAILVYTDA